MNQELDRETYKYTLASVKSGGEWEKKSSNLSNIIIMELERI